MDVFCGFWQSWNVKPTVRLTKRSDHMDHIEIQISGIGTVDRTLDDEPRVERVWSGGIQLDYFTTELKTV